MEKPLEAWYLVTPDQQVYSLEDEDPIIVLMHQEIGNEMEDFPVPIEACEDDFASEPELRDLVLAHTHVRDLAFERAQNIREEKMAESFKERADLDLGSFAETIIEAFDRADMSNLSRLKKAFPELAAVYLSRTGR